MKRSPFLVFVACLFSSATAGFAELPGKTGHHLSMQVDIVASGGATKAGKGGMGDLKAPIPDASPGAIQVGKSTVSSSVVHSNSPRYKVFVLNFGAQPQEATIEWYVFAKDVSPHIKSPTIWQHDKGSETITVGGKKSIEAFFQPKPILTKTDKSLSAMVEQSNDNARNLGVKTLATASVSGAKMVGWLVRLKVGGELVAMQASSPAIEEMGKSGKAFPENPKAASPERFRPFIPIK